MATIRKRTKKNGDVVYDCAIVIKKHGVIVHRESKTFNKHRIAKDWGFRREVELQEQTVYGKKEYLPIKDVIDQYIKEFPPAGRSKYFDLSKLAGRDIAKQNAHTLTTKDVIQHIRRRNAECMPQTANNDLIWLSTVCKTMKDLLDLDTDLSIFQTARSVLKKEGLIAKSGRRERRPTKEELWLLSRYFANKKKSTVPMLHLMWFAIFSARRESEITRIRWDEINHKNRTTLIRDLKDPRIKGKSKVAKIPLSAYKIIMKQPKTSEFVFPYNSKTIGTYFRNACRMLNIKDLRWHDLRHEATSRFFEKKLSIIDVQQITLHESWSTLKRYVNLNPGDVDI